MSRRRNENPISLFPFLAVLMSTMGALILLLLVTAHQAQRQAALEAQRLALQTAPTGREQEPLPQFVPPALPELPTLPPLPKRQEYEPLQLEPLPELPLAQVLQEHSLPTVPALQDERVTLRQRLADSERQFRQMIAEQHRQQNPAHIESLRRQLDEAQQRNEQLRTKLAQSQQQQAQQSDLEKKLAEQWRNLTSKRDLLREKVATKANQYAVVPYLGQDQSESRPVYLECRSFGILLRPEGVHFATTDLDTEPYPDHPLLALCQDLATHYRKSATTSPQPAEPTGTKPYPLLLVRPDGIDTFYLARAILDRFDIRFGYELLPDDVQVSYWPADPAVRRLAELVLFRARESYALLSRRRLPWSQPLSSTIGSTATASSPYAEASNRKDRPVDDLPVPGTTSLLKEDRQRRNSEDPIPAIGSSLVDVITSAQQKEHKRDNTALIGQVLPTVEGWRERESVVLIPRHNESTNGASRNNPNGLGHYNPPTPPTGSASATPPNQGIDLGPSGWQASPTTIPTNRANSNQMEPTAQPATALPLRQPGTPPLPLNFYGEPVPAEPAVVDFSQMLASAADSRSGRSRGQQFQEQLRNGGMPTTAPPMQLPANTKPVPSKTATDQVPRNSEPRNAEFAPNQKNGAGNGGGAAGPVLQSTAQQMQAWQGLSPATIAELQQRFAQMEMPAQLPGNPPSAEQLRRLHQLQQFPLPDAVTQRLLQQWLHNMPANVDTAKSDASSNAVVGSANASASASSSDAAQERGSAANGSAIASGRPLIYRQPIAIYCAADYLMLPTGERLLFRTNDEKSEALSTILQYTMLEWSRWPSTATRMYVPTLQLQTLAGGSSSTHEIRLALATIGMSVEQRVAWDVTPRPLNTSLEQP